MTQLPAGLGVGELKDQFGAKVKLSSFKGEKNVVVLFIPFSFTGTCTGELCAIRDDLAAFQNDDVQVLAISCDSPFTQKIFAEQKDINSQSSQTSGHMAQQLRLTEFSMRIWAVHCVEHSLSTSKA
jgi:peroxiredoxin